MPFFLENIAASPLLSNVQILFCSLPQWHFTLNMLFEMPHKSKGSSSCFVSKCNQKTRGISSYERCNFLESMGERSMRGRTQRTLQAPHKEVAFSQQHSQSKEKSPLSSDCFKNVLLSLYEIVNAGPCSNSDHSYWSHTGLFFFICILDIKKKLNQTKVPPC